MAVSSQRHLARCLVALTLLASACAGTATDNTAALTADSEVVEDLTEGGATETTAAEPETTTTAEAATTTTAQPVADPFDEITATVDSLVSEQGLDGAGLVIVHKDDGIVYEEYFGEFSADRISMIASSSKMISAGVLLKLQEDGLLDINAPVESQVDWAIGNPDITPAQLLSNSSGLVGLGPNVLYAPYLCQWGVPNTLQECGEAVFTTAADDDDQAAPDSEFRYGGAQWQVAGAVAESVSGKTWTELINEIYVEPCGVDSLGYVSLGAVLNGAPGYPVAFGGDPSSVTSSENPNVEGGAHITASDYAKLLLMHLRGGECDGTAVLSAESLATMHADRIGAAYDGDAGDNIGYGMGWWVDRETGRISDGGAWGASPWLDLDDGYGAYLIIEHLSVTGQLIAGEIEDLVHDAVTGG